MTSKKQACKFYIAVIILLSSISFNVHAHTKTTRDIGCSNQFLITIGYQSQSNLLPPDSIYAKVEIEAAYPFGEPNWLKYLQKTLQYPDEAASNNISGDVVVQFVVDTSGHVSDAKAVSGPKELQAEAIRVVQKSGLWVPALTNGKKVASYTKKTIKFRIG